jgi:hypothetical protein
VICPIHGLFNQLPSNHLQGSRCPNCGLESMIKLKTSNTESFICKANNIHNNKYDYSLTNYKHNNLKIKIICPVHGEFKQTPSNHLSGQGGCHECANISISKKRTKLKERFISESKLKHGDKYDYSHVNYINSTNKIKIICPTHSMFEQLPHNHLSGNGCPICKESRGEKEIRLFLKENNIYFIRGMKFSDCKNKLPLSFDFYLPNHNICVEYNGIQHYEFRPHFHRNKDEFILQQQNDKIKMEYCYKNNIRLIIIDRHLDIDVKLNEIIAIY